MSAGRRNQPPRGRNLGPKPGSAADRWRRSPEFRAIANQALAEHNTRRRELPKCGAKTKATGEPCRQVALGNGRCRFHGGRTPSGDAWHKIQLPKRGAARGLEKLDAKLDRQERVQAKRKRRIAAMSPEERERHSAWQASHRPGKAGDREHARRQRATKELFDEILAPRSAPPPAEDVFG